MLRPLVRQYESKWYIPDDNKVIEIHLESESFYDQSQREAFHTFLRYEIAFIFNGFQAFQFPLIITFQPAPVTFEKTLLCATEIIFIKHLRKIF